MSTTEFSIILPALPNRPWAAALSSCLAQEGVRATVTVLATYDTADGAPALDPAESALLEGLSVPDSIEVRWVSAHSAEDLHSYLAVLLSTPAQWVMLLHPDCVLAPTACAQARDLAVAHEASLVIPGTQEITLDTAQGEATQAIFGSHLASLDPACLLADHTSAILACAAMLSATVQTPVRHSFLFSLCSLAKRAHITQMPLAEELFEGAPKTLCDCREVSETAAIASQVGRMISQNQRWDQLRASYEVLCQELIEPFARACFPAACHAEASKMVAKEGPVSLFDTLAECWPLPELVSSIAYWATSHPETIASVVLRAGCLEAHLSVLDRVMVVTCPQSPLSLDDSNEIQDALDRFAIQTSKFYTMAPLAAEIPLDACSITALKATSSRAASSEGACGFPLALAQRWHRTLREEAPDLVVLPLCNSPELFWGALMARLAHIPVVAVAQSDTQDGSKAPWAKAAASLASVVAVDAETADPLVGSNTTDLNGSQSAKERFSASLTSALLAAHGKAPTIIRGASEPLALWASRVLDALEERLSQPPAPSMPADALLPLFDARLNSGQRSFLSAEQMAAQLEDRVEILEARLAASRSEAAMLRRRLAEAQGFTPEPRTPNCPSPPRDDC